MNIEEKIKRLGKFCEEQKCLEGCCPLFVPGLKCGRDAWFEPDHDGEHGMTEEEINLAYSIAFPDAEKPHIKDSGTRREFETGAVRDIQEGKGRCDLLPLDLVSALLANPRALEDFRELDAVSHYQISGDHMPLWAALYEFMKKHEWDKYTMILEVAKHFEEGAKKYGEYNWQKGIPTHCYIDSAVRHYLKWLRGDKDEPHDRAFVWNILCCIWTCQHKPELNDYRKEDKAE